MALDNDIIESKFEVGDKVIKWSGDYHWAGEVCAVFKTPNGYLRYVVAHPVDDGHVLHIYSEKNLIHDIPAEANTG